MKIANFVGLFLMMVSNAMASDVMAPADVVKAVSEITGKGPHVYGVLSTGEECQFAIEAYTTDRGNGPTEVLTAAVWETILDQSKVGYHGRAIVDRFVPGKEINFDLGYFGNKARFQIKKLANGSVRIYAADVSDEGDTGNELTCTIKK